MTRRVLYVAGSGNLLGGAEVCLFDVALGIRAQGWTPTVVVPFEGTLAQSLRGAGVEVVVMDVGALRHRGEARRPVLVLRLATALWAGLRLSRRLRSSGVALVHSNTSVVVAGAVAARLARVPHVWHVREILSPRARSLQRWVLPRFASRVLCISQAVRSAVAPYAANVEVLADGVDPDLFRQEAAPAGRGDVLMVARTHPEKGHEVFIRAAARVAQTVPGARFAIIGGTLPVYLPLQQRLAALADSLGLDERLEWVPHLSREELARCLASASVIVVPSTWTEPGGLVVLEAMACARPVVAPDRGGPAEVISNGVNGLLVEVAPEPIAAAIESLLRDPDQRRRIGEMARRRVVESYSLGAHLQRLAAIYEEVS